MSYIDKRNRKTRDLFQCLQCGFTAMADYIGAINIRLKAKIMAAIVNQPANCRRDFNLYLQDNDFNQW